jgi:Flp pilus assembly CpaE family ATPase
LTGQASVSPPPNGCVVTNSLDLVALVAVGSADPVGLQRLVRGLADLAEALPGCRPHVVVNKVRKGPVHGDVESQGSDALARYAGVDDVLFVPYDLTSLDRASAGGRSLAEAAAESPARAALMALAAQYAGVSNSQPRRRRRAGRPARRLAG